MDWIVIGAVMVAGWTTLSVLSGERISQSQRLSVLLAQAAEKAKLAGEDDVPIARANDAALIGSPCA